MDIIKPFSIFVQRPRRIAMVAQAFVIAWLLDWNSRGRGTALGDLALLIPAAAWLLYALWEYIMTTESPEANIRVDLLLIIPIVIIATITGVVLALRGRLSAA